MSIINKMLQDLDRRQGASDPDATLVQKVRSVPPRRNEREWFWRVIAVLMIGVLGWVAWIAWQLQPREPVATEQAFKAAENARRNAPPAPAPALAEPKPAAQQLADQKPGAVAKPAAENPAPQVAETVKLPPVTDLPVREPLRKPAIVAPLAVAKAGAVAAPTPRLIDLDVPPARILQAPAQASARVEKRDRVRTADDRAEAEFRRGAVLLNEGRVAESEDVFAAALNISPAHEASRQALIALNLEQGRIEDARRLLQEGLAAKPGNVQFAAVLARIFLERKEPEAALKVVDAARESNPTDANLNFLRGTILQRLARHPEAVEAYEAALRAAPQNVAALVSQAISLEAVGRRPEAASAFRRALASGQMSAELKDFAEQRLRALQ